MSKESLRFFYVNIKAVILYRNEVFGMMIDYENSEDFDFLQKEEIRKGIIKNLDVSVYAKPEIPFNIMRQLRKGLESGYDLSKYVYLGIEILPEIRKSFEHNILLDSYIIAGYDGEQLVAI